MNKTNVRYYTTLLEIAKITRVTATLNKVY